MDDSSLLALAIGSGVVGFTGLMLVLSGILNLIFLDPEGIWLLILGLVFWGWGWFMFGPYIKEIFNEE